MQSNDLNWTAYPDIKQDIVCLRSERLVTVETNCSDLPASCVNHNPVCREDCPVLHDQYWNCSPAGCADDPDCP